MSRRRRSSEMIDAASEVPPVDVGDAPPPPRELPPELGVVPLGKRDNLCQYIDALGQFRVLKDGDHRFDNIAGLVGTNGHLLEGYFPRYGKDGKPNGVDGRLLSLAFITACARRGVFDAGDRLRGRGAFLDSNAALAFHCGDAIWTSGDGWKEPGLVGNLVCPSGRALPRPWHEPVPGGERGPGAWLLGLLGTWRMRREIDRLLMLGWIVAGYLGGALAWRPHLWLTGNYGTGKSTLLRLLELVFAGALIKVSDASSAGLFQCLGRASLPVAIDEMEAEGNMKRKGPVIELARAAASGAITLRGAPDGISSEFETRSSFLFASILVPPLPAQDRSRLAIIELDALGAEAAPELDPRRLRETGQKILRRVLDGWPRWADTLAVYRGALMAARHDSRGADVYGTLLAAADLVLHDGEASHDYAAELAEQLDVNSLAEAEDAARDEDRCLQHLLTTAIPLDGPAANKRSIGDWIEHGLAAFEEDLRRQKYQLEPPSDDGGQEYLRVEAPRTLVRVGLKIYCEDSRDPRCPRYLAIANCHTELNKLFAGTHWAGRSGASGGWVQTLRRLKDARPSGKAIWFGAAAKATLIPIELVQRPKEQTATALAAQAPRGAPEQEE